MGSSLLKHFECICIPAKPRILGDNNTSQDPHVPRCKIYTTFARALALWTSPHHSMKRDKHTKVLTCKRMIRLVTYTLAHIILSHEREAEIGARGIRSCTVNG